MAVYTANVFTSFLFIAVYFYLALLRKWSIALSMCACLYVHLKNHMSELLQIFDAAACSIGCVSPVSLPPFVGR